MKGRMIDREGSYGRCSWHEDSVLSHFAVSCICFREMPSISPQPVQRLGSEALTVLLGGVAFVRVDQEWRRSLVPRNLDRAIGARGSHANPRSAHHCDLTNMRSEYKASPPPVSH